MACLSRSVQSVSCRLCSLERHAVEELARTGLVVEKDCVKKGVILTLVSPYKGQELDALDLGGLHVEHRQHRLAEQ